MAPRLHRIALLAVSLTLPIAGCGHSSGNAPTDGGKKDVDTGSPQTDSGGGPVDGGTGHAGDLLTQRGDVSRTGVNAQETVLTQENVSTKTFGKLGSFAVDGAMYTQPLYVSSYPVGGAMHNVLIAATASNFVYAFDADSGASIWSGPVNLGPPVPARAVGTNGTNAFPGANLIGVIGTPVIDRANGLLYVANMDYVNNVVAHRFHVLSLATGAEMKGSPVLVSPQLAGTGDGTSTLSFPPAHELNRAGLLLLNGVVYVAYASQFDQRPYHGFILGFHYDATTGTVSQPLAWATTADGQAGGIWQGGQGLTADAENNIYVMTGNGDTTAPDGGSSYGESFVKLTPELKVLDWFAPYDSDDLSAQDLDVGAGGPILIPGTSFVAGAGKPGLLYILDSRSMGHVSTGDTQIVQEFSVSRVFFGSPLAWQGAGETRLYLWGSDGPLQEFLLSSGKLGTRPAVTSMATNAAGLVSQAALSLSWNGKDATSAVLWANKPMTNANAVLVPGILYAFDPITLTDLWDSSLVTRDNLGDFSKIVPPTVANGKVYVATSSGEVVAYGLLPDGG